MGQLSLLGKTKARELGPPSRASDLLSRLWDYGQFVPPGPSPFSSPWKEAAIALVLNLLGLSLPWALGLIPFQTPELSKC